MRVGPLLKASHRATFALAMHVVVPDATPNSKVLYALGKCNLYIGPGLFPPQESGLGIEDRHFTLV